MTTVKRRKNAAVVVNPRIGALTPEEFKRLGFEVLGGRGWQRILAQATGWSPSTITRYIQGTLPVPKDVAVLFDALATLRRHDLPLPEAFSDDSGVGDAPVGGQDVDQDAAEAV